MTDLRDAARQALEALEFMADEWGFTNKANRPERWQAIDALRAALEQPEQEPVAWVYTGVKADGTEHGPHLVWKPEHMDAMSAEKGVVASPLYAHPPRRRWRGLTDTERAAVQYESFKRGLSPLEFMELHEAALKDRNA